MKGGKTRFQQKFTEDMFINAILFDRIRSTGTIMSLVGCSRSTAKNMLYKLVNEGKVNTIEIEGGCHGWQKVKGD
jgi:predicted transcriptional regulator